MTGSTDKIERLVEIVDAARERGLVLRALGGIAIAFHARRGVLLRDYGADADLDLATRGRDAARTEELLSELGYVPDAEFNALFGQRRLLFEGRDFPRIDVFVDTFSMCHELKLSARLDRHPYTLAPVDLALTKLQVHELTRKDALDVLSLVLAEELGLDEGELAVALSDDWGFYTTVVDNLEHLLAEVATYVPPRYVSAARTRLERLHAALGRAPKSLRWRMRARIGRRLQWYELPEENEFAQA